MWKILRPDAVSVIREAQVKKSLGRYLAVMQNEKPAKFQIAKKVKVEYSAKEPLELLWRKHSEAAIKFEDLEKQVDAGEIGLHEIPKPEKSYLDLKIEIAGRILRECHFCTRRCRVDRVKGELGFCRCGTETAVSSIFEHLGEEPELVPSGTIFTMGCTMRCKHCQNWTISQWIEQGEAHTAEKLAEAVTRLRRSGCRNANLVGGEPTPWLKNWLEAFRKVTVNIPVVWNSNSYYSPETAQLLAGFADIYLLDFKYGPEQCAEKISEAADYWSICTRNHLEAKKHGELIIRVLVLPAHLECCAKPILNWISRNLGEETRVNLMFQYRPEWRAYEIPELRRRLTSEEMSRAISLAKEAGLKNFIT